VVELFEIRSALEGLAMQLAASQITPSAIEDMKVELAHLRQLESDRIAWVDHHDTFHDALCQLSMRPHLCAEVRRVRLSIKPYLRHYVKGHADPEIKGYEHEYILEALQSGNPRRAEQAMRRHVMANAEAIANCLPVSSAESAQQRHKGSHRDDLGAAWPGDLRVAATRR
jgi:DNA-binding GntR family transcriptional regulator